jgi:hypothetical protein
MGATAWSLMTSVASHNDKAAIDAHMCPVCGKATRGQVDKRRALQEHIRRSALTCLEHKAWKDEWYSAFFIKGGNRRQQTISVESIKESIRKAYGEEWSNRITISG